MRCEVCGSDGKGVINTRSAGLTVVRERECLSCTNTFFTVEVPAAVLVKPNGTTEAFDPRQYFASIREAVRGEKVNPRGVTMAAARAISEAAQTDPRFRDLRIRQDDLVRQTVTELAKGNPLVAFHYLVEYHQGWATPAEFNGLLDEFFPKQVASKAPPKQQELVARERQIQGINGKKLRRLISGLALRTNIPLAQINQGVKFFLESLNVEDLERNEGIVFDYFFKPGTTLDSVGNSIGVTRQRAKQIVNAALRRFSRCKMIENWRSSLPEQSGQPAASFRGDFIFGNERNLEPKILEPKKKITRPPERWSFGKLKREGYLPLETVLHKAGLKAREGWGRGSSASTTDFLEQNGIHVVVKRHGLNRPEYHYLAPEKEKAAISLLRQRGQ